MSFEAILNYIYEYIFLAPINTLVEYFGAKSQYIVYAFALLLIVIWAVIILISKSFSYTTRISGSCDKVANYLSKLDKKSKKKNSTVSNQITLEDEEGFKKFNKKCFGKSCNKYLRDRWQFYLDNQKGLPSEVITSDQCLNRHSVGRGINRGRVLAFRYGAFLISLLALMYCIKFARVLEPEIPIMPGFITLLCLTLLFDLLINWVFTLADNGAVHNFYAMVNALDKQAAIYKDAAQYVQYYQGDQAYDEQAYDEQAYDETAYEEQAYDENAEVAEEPVQEYYDTTQEQYYDNSNEVYDNQATAEEPVYEDLSYQQYEELPQQDATEEPATEDVVETQVTTEDTADAPKPTAFQIKMQKIDALVDSAIASKASKQTYMGLAKMLIGASKTVGDESEKAQLKACAGKLMAQIK